MQQPRTSILHRIGKVFQARTEDIAHERLPERWVDLIQYLDAQEREREETQRKKRTPTLHTERSWLGSRGLTARIALGCAATTGCLSLKLDGYAVARLSWLRAFEGALACRFPRHRCRLPQDCCNRYGSQTGCPVP